MFHEERWEGTYEIEEITCDSSSVMSGRTSFSTSFSGSTEVSKYLSAVKEFQKLTENLENLSKMGTGIWQEVVEQAHKALQTAMAKLEEEFVHILVQNNKVIDPEHISLCLTQGHATNDESARDDQIQKQNLGGELEKYDGINLVHPDVALDLRSIVDMMFALNYGKQVSTAFTRVRKEALDECLTILGIKEFNTKDALQMGQDLFGQKLMVWIAAVKFVTQVYLPREKQLCNMIFRKFVSVAEDCFLGISAPQMGHLLNMGEDIVNRCQRREWLVPLIHMWEGLVNLPPDVNLLFNEVTGRSVRIKFCRLLRKLRDSATTIIKGFGNLIESSGSEDASPDGGVLHLTESVVCYMATISEHGEMLNVLFKDEGWLELDPVPEEEQSPGSSCKFWPNDCYLHSVACDLESILDSKSKLYEDISLQHIFLMNNIHYMVEKVRSSKLKHLLGDEWICEHAKKVQLHATTYRRITLGSVLSSLSIDDTGQLLLANMYRSKSRNSILKPKISAFNVAFEKTYKRQTGWLIPDIELREDLRISIGQILISAYRTFVGLHSLHEIIKYTEEDLTIFLRHLFEGSSRSIAKFQQKQS